jgi:hypothetical protein
MCQAISLILLAAVIAPVRLSAQSDGEMSLGEVARAARRSRQAPAKTVIDNDNFSQALDDVASHRPSSGFLFSFDAIGKAFQVSSPDVTCSLSFNANASSLLTDPNAARELPANELANLQGPADIQGDALEISIFNNTGWALREITVGLTILRHGENSADARFASPARLVPASANETVEIPADVPQKRPDVTVLYHLKGAAAPYGNTKFRGTMAAPLAPDEDWHWAIVQAKGVPPVAAPEIPAIPGVESGVPMPGPDPAKPVGPPKPPETTPAPAPLTSSSLQ